MGKKKMVMRRIAALLIASLVVTSSAFTSLAVVDPNAPGIYELQKAASSESDHTFTTKGDTITFSVEYGGKKSTNSDAEDDGKATSSDALKNATITWKSSNPNVATVAPDSDQLKGVVTAVGNGDAIITATAEGKNLHGGEAFTSVVEFNVKVNISDTPVVVTPTVKLSTEELTLNVGEKQTLTATADPKDATIAWKSSNEEVVTVKNGEVVAVGEGKADVTVTATKGDKTATAVCKVTVKKSSTPEDFTLTVELDKKDLELTIGDSVDLTATVKKDGVLVEDAKIKWINDGKDAISIVNGKVTALNVGKAIVIAEAEVDNKVAAAECNVVVGPKLTIDKETLTLLEGATGEVKLSVEPVEGVKIKELNNLGEDKDCVEITAAEDNKSFSVKAVKEGKTTVSIWMVAVDAEGKEYWSNNAKCEIQVLPNETKVEKIVEPEISADDFDNVEEVKAVVKEKTAAIQKAVKAAVENNKVETSEETKEIFNAIEEVPEGSELKLLSVNAEVHVEKDNQGNPVVVVKKLTYNIGVVTEGGEVLSHEKLEKNTKPISVNVPLPAEGIKNTWKYATIRHYADEGLTKLLNTLYSPIYGSGDNKYITIKSTKFSPFVLEFTEENEDPNKPATPSNTGSSSSGGGGGSRRHVVGGGGSSTNSYSMTGNWVMGANGWTFVKSDGQTAANTWGWINGQYYYFDANGNMMTGWQFINGKWYYLNPAEGSLQGAMLSGVLYDPAYNAYFYADASGAMVTGWYQVGANWYYFSPVNDGVHVTGQLLAGTYVDGYYLGADGAWVPGN